MAVQDRPKKSQTHETIEVTSPFTGEVIGSVEVSTEDDVRLAVEQARAAQPAWAARGVKERGRLLLKWSDLVWENQDEVMRIMRAETGKTDANALGEIIGVDTCVKYYMHRAPGILRPQRRGTAFPGVHWGWVHSKPVGVVGLIEPWNYPFLLPFMDIVPALIAGNAIVLKPSEVSPMIAQYGIDMMVEAGIPRDVIQVVQGAGATGAALIEHVDYIHFTGSTATGRKVGVRAAERMIPFSLELGGKDPVIVLNDADVDMAATALLRGAFENVGQACVSIERAYVEEGIYDKLVERVLHYARELNVGAGDGMDVHVGSLTNQRELERSKAHIEDAVQKGAKVIHGGMARPDLGPLFFEPTVLVNVDHNMLAMTEETFGPLLPIMKVENAEEAIRLANETNYGLSASIYTRDVQRAKQLALMLDTGDVGINVSQLGIATPNIPTGGQRESGYGRRNGPEGLKKYTVTQSLLINNNLGQKPELILLNPMTKMMILALRVIRRYLPV